MLLDVVPCPFPVHANHCAVDPRPPNCRIAESTLTDDGCLSGDAWSKCTGHCA